MDQTIELDKDILDMLIESLGADRAHQVIREYLVLVENVLREAHMALDAKDYDQFVKSCHKIKSNIAYIGGKELEELCIQIERFHAEKNYGAIEALSKDFKNIAAQTIEASKSIFDKEV